MKQTHSIELPIEINGQVLLRLKITASARDQDLPSLDNAGFGQHELHNKLRQIVQLAAEACDGSVPGLIVGTESLETL